jgi:transcriptional regulator with XRE-family HTH domain
MKNLPTLSEQLRQIVADCPISLCELSRQTGINKAVLSKFIRGQRGMLLESLDKLGRYFRLRVVAEEKPRKEKGR